MLNWHSRCLQAAGVAVQFPEAGCGASPEEEIWFTVTIGDRSCKAVLDTGAMLSIVALRLAKRGNPRKIKTMAIRAGHGRAIPSPGGAGCDHVSWR